MFGAGIGLAMALVGAFEWAAASGDRTWIALVGCGIILIPTALRAYIGFTSGEPAWPDAWYRWRETRRRAKK